MALLPNSLYEPAHTAMLIIDMQNDFCDAAGKLARAGGDISAVQAIIPGIAALLGQARVSGVPVIHIKVVQAADGSTLSPSYRRLLQTTSPEAPFGIDGTWGAEIVAPLAPRTGETVIIKHRSGAFTNTTLETELRKLGVSSVAVVGEQTPGCIEATVRQAADLDFEPILVSDLVAAFDSELHAAALKVMRARWPAALAAEVSAAWRDAHSRKIPA